MAFFAILEPILAILILGFLLSQTVVPEILGQPWFPIFRRGWKVRGKIAEADENAHTQSLERKLKEKKDDRGIPDADKQSDRPC